MNRPPTAIYNSSRDYTSIPEIEVLSGDDTDHLLNVFQSALAFIFVTCIAALSLIDFFLN